MDRLYFRQPFDDERADRSLLRLAHPTEREMVGVRVEGVRRTKSVVLAFEGAPKESVTLQVEWRLETFRLTKGLRQKEDGRLMSGACSLVQ